MNTNDIYDMEWIEIDTNRIHHTAVIFPCVTLGKNNVIGPYAVIGGNGEIRGKDQKGFKGRVIIGDRNVISELVTIQRPFNEDAITSVGDDNIITAHSHIGHDVTIGNSCEICYSIIGGYAVVEDGARIKMSSTIRNRKRVGKNATVGMCSVVVKDVDAGTTVYGNPARPKTK